MLLLLKAMRLSAKSQDAQDVRNAYQKAAASLAKSGLKCFTALANEKPEKQWCDLRKSISLSTTFGKQSVGGPAWKGRIFRH